MLVTVLIPDQCTLHAYPSRSQMTYQLSNLLVINYTFIIYQHIYDELSLAAEAFLDDEGCQVDMAKRTIKLSQILKWYSVDFGKNKEEVSMW